MANQTFPFCELTRFQDATQVSNTVTETVIVPDFTLGANYFTQGKTLRGRLLGKCSNVVTTPGTLTYRIHLGPLTLSATNVVASAAIVLDTVAHTDSMWEIDFYVVCRSAGTAGSAMVIGQVSQSNVLPTAANEIPIFIPASGATAGTLDTTVANLLGISAQFSVATNPTNLTTQMYMLESLN